MNWHKRRAFLGRGLRLEHLESRSLLAGLIGESPWQNPLDSNDLDFDGAVSPSDALVAINAINGGVSGEFAGRFAPPQLQGEFQHAATAFLDADGDSALSPSDALTVINALNSHAGLGQETPVADQGETIGEAFELSLTNGFARVRGVIAGNEDVDFFKVVAEKTKLHVALYSRGTGGLTITLLDPSLPAAEQQLDSAQIEAGSHSAAKLNVEATAGTTYYLRVEGVGGPYALAVLNFDELTFTPQPDAPLGQDRHGDTTEEATELTLQRNHAQVVSHIDAKPASPDADVFALTAADGKLVLTADAQFDLSIEVSDADIVLQSLTVSNRQPVIIDVTAGAYFIKVAAANEAATGAYRLRVANVPELGDDYGLPNHPGARAVDKLFELADTNGDHAITPTELDQIPEQFAKLADHVLGRFDLNNDGTLTLEEVTASLSTLPPLLPNAQGNDGPGPLRRVLGLRLDPR